MVKGAQNGCVALFCFQTFHNRFFPTLRASNVSEHCATVFLNCWSVNQRENKRKSVEKTNGRERDSHIKFTVWKLINALQRSFFFSFLLVHSTERKSALDDFMMEMVRILQTALICGKLDLNWIFVDETEGGLWERADIKLPVEDFQLNNLVAANKSGNISMLNAYMNTGTQPALTWYDN